MVILMDDRLSDVDLAALASESQSVLGSPERQRKAPLVQIPRIGVGGVGGFALSRRPQDPLPRPTGPALPATWRASPITSR